MKVMAKKAAEKAVKKEAPEVAPEVKEKKSVREILSFAGEDVAADIEEVKDKLKEMEQFARKNNRPAKHFFVFAQQLGVFTDRFKRSLR
jgi:hypothetical protein